MEKYITLKDGTKMPRLGMGTWYLGESAKTHDSEVSALRAGLDAGYELIDTAEMYGDGGAEKLIGDAIRGYDREKLYIVSKVYPHNAGRRRIEKSCEDTLRRLKTDYLDIYLLHWRGSIPLSETAECMEKLVASGKIRRWGVSNLDTADMQELLGVQYGKNCTVNQVLYHLGSRGVEYDLLPYLQRENIPLMAYCPLAQGGDLRRGLLSSKSLRTLAEKYGVTPHIILLAFVLHNKSTIAIPRSGNAKHIVENRKALDIDLTDEDMRLLNTEFPAPTRKTYLDIV